jgi:hypothetical protein
MFLWSDSGGATTIAVAQSGVEVDVVELSAGMAKGAEWLNHRVLPGPDVHLHIGDGRNYLMLCPKHYDVVLADIIRPYHSGAGNLYSIEYFQLVKNALTDEGLMLQWVDGSSEAPYKLIMRTFLSVFPGATLWNDGSIIVGTKRPEGAQSHKPLTALPGLFTADEQQMREYVGSGALLTDDKPELEYFLSLGNETTPAPTWPQLK